MKVFKNKKPSYLQLISIALVAVSYVLKHVLKCVVFGQTRVFVSRNVQQINVTKLYSAFRRQVRRLADDSKIIITRTADE